jgi:hypothetical protein
MLINELTRGLLLPAVLHEDNTGAIFLLNNEQVGACTKHIDIRYRFINDLIKEGTLRIQYIASENNPADIMTKNLSEALAATHDKNIHEGTLLTLIQNKEDVKDSVLKDIKNEVLIVLSDMNDLSHECLRHRNDITPDTNYGSEVVFQDSMFGDDLRHANVLDVANTDWTTVKRSSPVITKCLEMTVGSVKSPIASVPRPLVTVENDGSGDPHRWILVKQKRKKLIGNERGLVMGQSAI